MMQRDERGGVERLFSMNTGQTPLQSEEEDIEAAHMNTSLRISPVFFFKLVDGLARPNLYNYLDFLHLSPIPTPPYCFALGYF